MTTPDTASSIRGSPKPSAHTVTGAKKAILHRTAVGHFRRKSEDPLDAAEAGPARPGSLRNRRRWTGFSSCAPAMTPHGCGGPAVSLEHWRAYSLSSRTLRSTSVAGGLETAVQPAAEQLVVARLGRQTDRQADTHLTGRHLPAEGSEDSPRESQVPNSAHAHHAPAVRSQTAFTRPLGSPAECLVGGASTKHTTRQQATSPVPRPGYPRARITPTPRPIPTASRPLTPD